MPTIVYIPGVWDLLHVGHVQILERAKALGDKLVVGVPTDEVVLEDKGAKPIIPLHDRMKMLSSLRCVDLVLPYEDLEFITHLDMIRPDILAVGMNWGHEHRHEEAEAWIRRNSKRMVRLPYYAAISSTDIKRRIIERKSQCVPS